MPMSTIVYFIIRNQKIESSISYIVIIQQNILKNGINILILMVVDFLMVI